MLGFGPIVKSVRDAALIYSIVHPAFTPPADWSLPPGVRVVSFGSFHKTVCSPETLQTLGNAQAALRARGAEVAVGAPEFAKDLPLVWQLAMSEDKGQAIIEMAYPGRPKAFFGDWVRAKLGMSPENHPYLSWAILGTNLFPPNAAQEKWFKQYMDDGPRLAAELLGENGVFVIPTYPTPTKPHGQVYAELFSIAKTFRWKLPFIALPNAFGLPAIVVPCGRSGDGLPIGLQVVGTVGREQLVFRVAAALERELGGWRRCTKYDAA
jgi:Asp-tRNA(Asn)/Glu-tRNA(Gln) amidotransferase A subunit family amidase